MKNKYCPPKKKQHKTTCQKPYVTSSNNSITKPRLYHLILHVKYSMIYTPFPLRVTHHTWFIITLIIQTVIIYFFLAIYFFYHQSFPIVSVIAHLTLGVKTQLATSTFPLGLDNLSIGRKNIPIKCLPTNPLMNLPWLQGFLHPLVATGSGIPKSHLPYFTR